MHPVCSKINNYAKLHSSPAKELCRSLEGKFRKYIILKGAVMTEVMAFVLYFGRQVEAMD